MEIDESNEKGLETRLKNALGSRGVTLAMHETKMANLARLSKGGVVVKALDHDRYRIGDNLDHYNPYTDTWIEIEQSRADRISELQKEILDIATGRVRLGLSPKALDEHVAELYVDLARLS